MKRKILLCAIDAIVFYDNERNVYVNKDIGWFNRFTKNDVDYFLLAKGKHIDNTNELVRLDESINLKGFTVVPDISPINIVKSVIQLLRIVGKEVRKVDGVVIRYQGLGAFVPCYLSRKYKIKSLIELGGDPWDAFWNHGFLGKILAFPMTLLCKKDMKHADFAHYVTQQYLQEKYPSNGKILSLSNVELKPFDDIILDNRLQRIASQKETNIYSIGTAAAVNVRYKGQQYVIRALSILKQKGFNNFRYEIAGKGNNSFLKSIAIKYGVEKEVVFLGTLSHDEIFDWLDNLDVYLQPSLQEGLPRAMVEAMSRALPCIGAKTAGIPELIDKTYIYSNRKSPKTISNLLLKIIHDQESQAQLNFVKSKEFDKEYIQKKRTDFYNLFFQF